MNNIIAGLFLLGLSFGSGPCLASCGPILISYIVGTHKNIPRSLIVYLVFSLTRISVYLVLGILVFFAGKLVMESWLGEFSKYIFIVGGIFILAVGILTVSGNKPEIAICRFLNRAVLERDKKSVVTMGLIIGFLPCPPLLALFSYIALVSKAWPQSIIYSLSFGLGTLISPLLLLVILAGFIPRFFINRRSSYGRIFSVISGTVLIFLGVNLITRAF